MPRFDKEKFREAMLFLAERVEDLTVLKAAKLLYLADRHHVRNFGHPILGDWYVAMDHGPVPSNAYDELKRLRDESSGALAGHVHMTAGDGSGHPVIQGSWGGIPYFLSEAEVESLHTIARTAGRKTASLLIDETHLHRAWKAAREENRSMRYEEFFDDPLDERDEAVLELLKEGFENDEFLGRFEG